MSEACGARGIFAEEVPPRTWQFELSQFSKEQLRKVYKRYIQEAPQFPPDLPTVIAWAKLPMPNKYGSIQAAYNNDTTQNKKLPLMKAEQSVKEKHISECYEMLGGKPVKKEQVDRGKIQEEALRKHVKEGKLTAGMKKALDLKKQELGVNQSYYEMVSEVIK